MNDAPLMLSVSGLRGLVNKSLTPTVAARYGFAIATWVKLNTNTTRPHIIIGRDSRPSGPSIERAVVAGLISNGCKVTRIGIISTPGVAVMITHLNAHAGIVITASHNPIIWNGIKIIRHDTMAPTVQQTQQIIDIFHATDLDYDDVAQHHSNITDDTAAQVHIDRILQLTDVNAIRSAKPRIVVDSVHGAGGSETSLLLNQLGADLIHLYAEPTGQFPHDPEPTKDNLVGLCNDVTKYNADIGFAQDPDADRLAVVDENGNYIGEEYTLVLTAMHILNHTPGIVVTNLSTSRMIDDIAARLDSRVIRAAVGEANVASAMQQNNAVIGGEGNGGIIWPNLCHVRDSLAGIAIILELIATSGKSISQLVQSIPTYSIIKDKLPITQGLANRAITQLKQQYANQQLNFQDGIRIDFDDKWIHVRPSNTEPIIRICGEAASDNDANRLINDIRRIVKSC